MTVTYKASFCDFCGERINSSGNCRYLEIKDSIGDCIYLNKEKSKVQRLICKECAEKLIDYVETHCISKKDATKKSHKRMGGSQ